MTRKAQNGLAWQSKGVLLLVLPFSAVSVFLQSHWWYYQAPVVAWATLGISGLFGLIVWKMKAGTAGAAASGAVITASLMYATTRFPYQYSWLHGGLPPLLAVFLLTYVATKVGRAKKERFGTAESNRGRNAAQVAANLGISSLGAQLMWMFSLVFHLADSDSLITLVVIAVLAEAAADTVSSEIGQVLGGTPRLLTTLAQVEPGTDGGVTVAGTAAGILAAALVAFIGVWSTGENLGSPGGQTLFCLATLGGVFGLLFDSLLGATLERKRWLNNDAVNFLSTLSAAIFPFALIDLFLQFRPGSVLY